MACSGSNTDQLTLSMTNFSISIYTELVKAAPKGNVLFSPLSIFAALSMTLAGAKEKTLKEMTSGMHLDDTNVEKDFHVNFGKHLASLTKASSGVQINIANKLFLEKTYEIVSAFTKLMKEAHSAKIRHVDFISNSNRVRKEINKWVEDLTKQKIKDLLPEGSVDSITRLVLVNAIYFKGSWMSKFKKKNTKTMDFFTLDNQAHKVQMMCQEDCVEYSRDCDFDCSMVKLPFKDPNYALMIILPNKRDGLPVLEEKLTGPDLRKLLTCDFEKRGVLLKIPKFKVESSFDLVPTLKALGMQDMFSPSSADLSGLSPGNDLFVSEVVHKAFLELDESGAEAAVATQVKTRNLSAIVKPPPILFVVHYPFLVMILDKIVNPVFFGRMLKP